MKNLNVWMLLACVSLLSGCDEALDDGADGGADTSTGDGGATLKSLVAKSGGVEIGVVLDADLYGLTIWDRRNDIIFYLNQATGNVGNRNAGDVLDYPYNPTYWDSACTQLAAYVGAAVSDETEMQWNCLATTLPERREAWGRDNDRDGFNRATGIVVVAGPTGRADPVYVAGTDGQCRAMYRSSIAEKPFCFFPTVQTGEIPTHFSLPIEVVER